MLLFVVFVVFLLTSYIIPQPSDIKKVKPYKKVINMALKIKIKKCGMVRKAASKREGCQNRF